MRHKKIFILTTLIISISIFFALGFYHLAQFKTADEHYWIQERTPAYWKALEEEKYKKTLINDKPGITVALISGIGLLWEKNPIRYLTKIDDDLKIYDTSHSERVNFIFRLPILLFNAIFLFFLFWIIKKAIQNSWVALWSVMLIALSPILIGISQIINPDALLWTFSSGAIFSYFALLKTREKKFIFLTAIFSGLAILSKYTADILFPFFFFFMLLYYLFEVNIHSPKEARIFLFSQMTNFFLIIIGALGTIIFFLPAILIKPIYLYRLTLGFGPMQTIFFLILIICALIITDQLFPKKSFLLFCKKHQQKFAWLLRLVPLLLVIIFFYLIVGRNFFSHWKLFEIVPFDAREFKYIENFSISLWQKIIIEFNPLVFSLAPLAVASLACLWINTFLGKKLDYFFYVIALSCFILVYYLTYILMDTIAIVRYSIIVYPLVSFLAAIGFWELSVRLKKYDVRAKIAITLLILVPSITSLFMIKPFYFNYNNFLLPKESIISDAWGYGGYEAAQYLNNLPGSHNLTVWSDYYGVCEFFVGKCITDNVLVTGKYDIDYYVLTRRGEIRYREVQPRWSVPNGIKALPYYDDPLPLWKLEIGNRPQNYIKIIKSIQ